MYDIFHIISVLPEAPVIELTEHRFHTLEDPVGQNIRLAHQIIRHVIFRLIIQIAGQFLADLFARLREFMRGLCGDQAERRIKVFKILQGRRHFHETVYGPPDQLIFPIVQNFVSS